MKVDTLPPGRLLAYYGDDFTGSTDALEAMSAAGVPTVLFLERPTPESLRRFPEARCIGMAGSSRGRSPAWMDRELPAVFEALAALGAPILQYKVCSTFDSSPQIGSIGRAIDIGIRHTRSHWSPTIVGSPALKRYQVFGNLFAAVDGVAYRLDRHPTMSRHPVTPMHEADLRLHLAAQTARPIHVLDMVQLRQGNAAHGFGGWPSDSAPVVLIDVVDDETILKAGRLVWEQREDGLFSASSSGLQYALAAYWRSRGWIPEKTPFPPAEPVSKVACVSGSCSPVTAGQIRWARANGFHVERLQIAAILDARAAEDEVVRAADTAIAALRNGRSAIVFSAEGPEDAAVTSFDALVASHGVPRQDAARMVGQALAHVMRRILDSTDVSRAVVAGGDSSGEVASALGIEALTVAARLAPGAPLCRAWSDVSRRDGLEIVLKGGQMGGEDFFGLVRDGHGALTPL